MKQVHLAAVTILLSAVLSKDARAEDFWVAIGNTDWHEAANVSAANADKYQAGYSVDGQDVVVETTEAANVAGAGWRIKLNQNVAIPVRFSTEANVIEAAGGLDVCLYADVNYADGSSQCGLRTPIPVKTAAGKRHTLEVVPTKPIAALSVYTMLRKSAGRVRFHGMRFEALRVPDGCCRLDTVLVRQRPAPEKAGFYLRDAAAGSGFEKVEGSEAKGIRVKIDVEERKGGVRLYDVSLAPAKASVDRAMTLMFAIPFDKASAIWHDDPRTDVPLADKNGEQSYVFPVPCGAGMLTQWPIGAVSDGKRSVAIGVDPLWPSVYRIVANADLGVFFIAMDLGFAPEHATARVKFAVFPFARGQGFRGALVAYDGLYPQAFESRIPEYGVWQVSTPIEKIVDYQDFGFMYMEGGGTHAWDDAHGIYTFKYTEPGSWWMTCLGKNGGLPTMAECRATAEGWLSQTTNKGMRVRAACWKKSVALDAKGDPIGEIQFAPWTKGIMWCMNSAPGINDGDNDYWYKNSEKDFAERYREPFPKGMDGEYIDSSEMCYNFGCDYDRSHFAGMKTPLSFGCATKRVCVAGAMASYEYVRTTSERLKKLGKYTMANSTPYRTSMLVPFLDVPGTEIKWYRPGRWSPDNDRRMLYRRAVCGRKPYCFLQNTEFDEFHPYVERYMQKSLAYGMLSGFFSSNGSTDCYFSKRERYEIDRPLFKKYIPLQKKLAKAGWRPIATLAASSNPNVYVEQFGDRYITVYNGSRTESRTAVITSPKPSAAECVTGETWTFENGSREVTLPPETVRMLEFAQE